MTYSSSPKLLILLHGVGANGADLAPVGDLLASQISGLITESPNAPNRSDFGPGFQWFSVAGVTVENRSGRVKAAREAFDALVDSLITKHGFQDQLNKVAFLGFSQGSIMGLDAVVSGRWPVAGLVAFSGRLATPDEDRAAKVPTLLLHGASDPVIPASETLSAEQSLTKMGLTVTSHIYPGLGHSISQEGLRAAKDFLADAFSTKT